MTKKKLTKEEAEQMLAQLTEYYGEPVKPVSKFCAIVLNWYRAMRDGDYYSEETIKALKLVRMGIPKSNFLARLLYNDEPVRTEKCPAHKGRWSGVGRCTYGCDQTGWLRTPELVQSRLAEFRKRTGKTDEEAIEFMKTTDYSTISTDCSKPEAWDIRANYRLYCEWVTHLGHGDLVPEKEKGSVGSFM